MVSQHEHGCKSCKRIAAETANKLGKDFDIDITDIHHKEKEIYHREQLYP